MTFRVEYDSFAEKQLHKLSTEIQIRVLKAIQHLLEEPRPHGCLKLEGSKEWRIRVGHYRVRYIIDDRNSKITITRVSPRDDAYED